MADAYLVQVNLPLIAKNLSKAEGREFSIMEVEDWLQENGYVRTEGGWLVEEISLGLLDKSEILSMKPYA